MKYQKINTLSKRDNKNIIIPSQYTCEKFKAVYRDNLNPEQPDNPKYK